MSIANGPNEVTSGLVYYHDMANTQKSWKGAPTTNLATSQTLVNHSLVTLPTFSDAPERGYGWKKVIVTATSTNFRMLKMDVFNVAANSTTTYSIEFECSNSEVYLNIDGTGFGGGTWTQIGPTRYSRTVTTAIAGTAYLFVNSNNLSASVNYVIYYKEYQVEANSFATPYVISARSTTQALVDLTNNKTVTANSLTYNSDGTYSFTAASANYATLSHPTALTRFTAEIWAYPTGYTGTACAISDIYPGTTSTINFCIYANGQWQGGIYQAGWYYSPTAIQTNNVWQHVVYTYDGVNQTIYLNGVSGGSTTTYSGDPTTGTTGIVLGRRWDLAEYFSGRLDVVKIYNRALTAEEIRQNFNALRGRFGL